MRLARRLGAASLGLAILLASAQAGAATQAGRVKHTTQPVWDLAIDGSRVAYMRADRKVAVWNVATGKTTVIKGTYPRKGSGFGVGTGEVAIAGKRIALITRFVTGNSQQTQERLYTATVGGSARPLAKVTNHYTNPQDGQPDGGLSNGTWVAGVVGSGNLLAVSTWSSNDSMAAHERLNLVTPTGLHAVATGPGTTVARSANDGHIAVLRSTLAWPADDVSPATSEPSVGIYSSSGSLLDEVALDPSASDIALSGNELVVLTETIPQPGSLTATLQVYDWRTGTLVHTWPIALGHQGGARLAVHGRLATVDGPSRVRLVDLTTGREVAIAGSSRSPAALGKNGLVYALNSRRNGPGKLVFLPWAKLLADVG
jgi:hypothetical protein